MHLPLIHRLALAALLAAAGAAQSQDRPAPAAPASAAAARMSDADKLSYATGVVSIRNFMKNDVRFNLEMIVQGMRDAAAAGELALSEKEIRLVMNQLQTELRRNMAANRKELLEKNRQRGTEYLAAYKAKAGVQAMSNGIAYRVLKAGSGPKPGEQDTVVVHYRGTLTDGTEFDATPEGKSANLRMNSVIVGWREALKQMPVGSHWEVVIPSALAYGERGVGDVIAPNETLVFDVELLEIKR